VGLTATAADASLQQLGFTDVVNDTQCSQSAVANTVVNTLPEAGNSSRKNLQVTVLVNNC
jgi:beta-lactam-binding protein with PASTA domain